MKRLTLLLLALCCAASLALMSAGSATAQTKSTYRFAHRDTCDLYLDLYMPEDGALLAEGKPVVLFVFGGGFVSGSRDQAPSVKWFKQLCAEGYPVVSIDYRLGLKGIKYSRNIKFLKAGEKAIDIAVEDLFSATKYLVENARSLGIEGRGIVTAGSSAGAITVLQAEYYIANRLPQAQYVPKDFNYAGVMSFAGAIFSKKGRVSYKTAPCPQILFHGTKDKMVPYKQKKVFNLCFGGTNHIAKSLARENCNYQVWRFKDHYHDIAASMSANLERELDFLENNVIKGEKTVVDALVDDPTLPIPSWAAAPIQSLYK